MGEALKLRISCSGILMAKSSFFFSSMAAEGQRSVVVPRLIVGGRLRSGRANFTGGAIRGLSEWTEDNVRSQERKRWDCAVVNSETLIGAGNRESGRPREKEKQMVVSWQRT